MPGLKRSYSVSTYTAPRPTKKAKTRYRSVGLVRQPRFILGKTQRATFRYSETVVDTSSAVQASLGTYVFSANGCYDPNNTGTGHQPRGFDQLMTLYDHYTVLSSKITVRFTNASASSRPFCAIAVRDGNVHMADFDAVGEYGDVVISAKPLYRQTTNDEAGLGESVLLTKKCNIAKFLGRKDAMSDPELKGSASGNPSEQVFYHVIVSDVNSSSAASVNCTVFIEYNVIMHEPKQPASS